jgi:hypothetical protein
MELARRSPTVISYVRCFRRVNKTSGAGVYLLPSKFLNTSEISYLWCIRTFVSVFIYLFITLTSVYLLIVDIEGYCCTWSQSLKNTHTHTHTHTHAWYGSSGRGIGLSQRPLPGNTHHTHKANIHAQGGIRTRNPSKRTTADPVLRPRFLGGYKQFRCITLFLKVVCIEIVPESLLVQFDTPCWNSVLLVTIQPRSNIDI